MIKEQRRNLQLRQSAYEAAIPWAWGTARHAGIIIWATLLIANAIASPIIEIWEANAPDGAFCEFYLTPEVRYLGSARVIGGQCKIDMRDLREKAGKLPPGWHSIRVVTRNRSTFEKPSDPSEPLQFYVAPDPPRPPDTEQLIREMRPTPGWVCFLFGCR